MYVYWFFFRNSHQLHICQFSFAHNYTTDEYRTTGTMIRVDGQKKFSKKLKTRQFQSIRPVNDCHHRAKRKDFLFESVREEVFMNFNVVILNKTRVVYKNIYCRFSVMDLQLLYSSLGKMNAINDIFQKNADSLSSLSSLIEHFFFLFECALWNNFIILHHLLCFIWIISCQK